MGACQEIFDVNFFHDSKTSVSPINSLKYILELDFNIVEVFDVKSGLGIKSFDLSIFNLSLFSIFEKDRPWSNHSRQSFKKFDRDRIALVDLLKRSTVSESLSSIEKEQRKRFNLFHNRINLLIKNEQFDQKNVFFLYSWQFFPLFMPKERIAHVDLQSFLKIEEMVSLSSIFLLSERKRMPRKMVMWNFLRKSMPRMGPSTSHVSNSKVPWCRANWLSIDCERIDPVNL